MKFLFMSLIVALSFLAGCDDDAPHRLVEVKQDSLEFKANDLVLLHNNPFYENCFGVVVDYEPLKLEGKPQKYKVMPICRMGPLGKTLDLPETDLQLRLRSPLQTEEQGQ